MSYTAGSYELEVPLAFEQPSTVQIGTTVTPYVSLSGYHRAHLDILVGTMAAGATLDCQLLQAQDALGTNAKVIANKAGTGNKAITQLTQAGGDGNELLRIELQTEELDVDGGFDFIAAQLVVAVNTVAAAGVLYGCIARYKPTPTTNWTEIVD